MLSRLVFLLSVSCVCVLSELYTNGSCPEVTQCGASYSRVIQKLWNNKLDCMMFPKYTKCLEQKLADCWNTSVTITGMTSGVNATVNATNDAVSPGNGNTTQNGTAANTAVVWETVNALRSADAEHKKLCAANNMSGIVNIPADDIDLFNKTYNREIYVPMVYKIYEGLKKVNGSMGCNTLHGCYSILQPYMNTGFSNITIAYYPCHAFRNFGDCYQAKREACEQNLQGLDEAVGRTARECVVDSAPSTRVCFLLFLGTLIVSWQTLYVFD